MKKASSDKNKSGNVIASTATDEQPGALAFPLIVPQGTFRL